MFLRVQILGSLGSGGAETWSSGFAVGLPVIDTPSGGWNAALNTIGAAMVTNVGTTQVGVALRSLLSTQGTVSGYRLEVRNENESLEAVSEVAYPVPIAGTGTANKTPQSSVVGSLRTTTPGPRGRGRMYWPALSCTLSTAFQITAPTTADIAAGFSAYLQALNDQVLALFPLSFAFVGVRSVTDHQTRPVNAIHVGTVLDTQRRRRDAIPETYAIVPFPD